MDRILVKRDELKAKVYANRAAHRKIFEEALAGYRKKSLELLEEHIEEVRKGQIVRVVVNLPFPEDHTSDYDRVIMMLEMSVEEELQIDEESFANYVMDQWSWTRAFLASNSAYSATARHKLTP